MPREARIAAREAAAMPFPREETTPPVTNTNLVMGDKFRKLLVYRNSLGAQIAGSRRRATLASHAATACRPPSLRAIRLIRARLHRGRAARVLRRSAASTASPATSVRTAIITCRRLESCFRRDCLDRGPDRVALPILLAKAAMQIRRARVD